MQRLIRILFNVDPAPWTSGGSIRLEWLNAPRHDLALLMIIALLFAAIGILYLYKREAKTLARPIRIGLASLRLLALLGVLAMLLEPNIVFVKREMIPSQLLVLTDRSESMDLKDAYANGSEGKRIADILHLKSLDDVRNQSRLALATEATQRHLLTPLSSNGDRTIIQRTFSAQLLDITNSATQSTTQFNPTTDPSNPLPSVDRTTTGIGTAITQTLAAYRGQPLAGILLITDGQSNTGDPLTKAAEAAAAEGVPVVSLAVGTPEGPRNAAITKIDVSPVVFVRDTNQARILIESRGLAGAPATVVLEKQSDSGAGAWEEIGRKEIVLEESGAIQTVPFDFKEDRPTKLVLRATIQDVGPELTTADNVQLAEVRVIREKIKVLFVAGHPFPEYEFIRNMLLRDNALSAAVWLQTADKDYDQPGTPGIKRLPATPDELNEFDCVILYDPNPELWPEQFPQMIADFVGKAGGGLVYIAGERFTKDFFDRPDDPNSAWLPLLPVVAEPGLYRTDITVRLSASAPWKLEITPEGHADPIFQFSDKPEENDRILSALPGMFWHYPVTRAKAGATVLARHADPRMRNEYGNHVLLATQLVGPGRTFFIGFDSTYRWRFLDEQTFDGFWARIIDRAGRSKQLGGRYPYSLTTDRASYRPGSQVTLTARFENPADRDAGLTEMHGEVESTSGTTEGAGAEPLPITLTARKGDPSAFDVTFPVTHAGPYFIKVWAGDLDARQTVRAATLEFPVELPNLEFDQPTVNLPVLQNLAKQTGGQVFTLSQVDQVPDAFKVKRVARNLEDRQSIFNAPILFSLILACLFLEWILRKKYRLI